MPGLFGPGMRLMGNLQFAAKALLICLMFMLPIAWLTWSFYRSHTDRMAFSAKELLGVRYNPEMAWFKNPCFWVTQTCHSLPKKFGIFL